MKPQEYAKAIAGGILAGLGALYLGLADGVVTAQEWVGVAQTSLAAFAVVWGVPNAPKSNTVSQTTVTTETKQVVAPEHIGDVPDSGDVVLPDLTVTEEKPVNGL